MSRNIRNRNLLILLKVKSGAEIVRSIIKYTAITTLVVYFVYGIMPFTKYIFRRTFLHFLKPKKRRTKFMTEEIPLLDVNSLKYESEI